MKKTRDNDVEKEGEDAYGESVPVSHGNWLRYTIRTNYTTGEETITYSHTPEEFVEELRRRNERVVVSRGSCSECVYTPDRTIPREVVKDCTTHVLSLQRVPECICVTASRRVARPHAVPYMVVCYGFYYQHWYKNTYLVAAKEAGLVTFYEVGDLPGLQETGLKLMGPPYYS